MSKERFCFKIVYTPGSEPKKILSKFHYDLIDIDEKKRIGASVVYMNRKEKVIKLHFKNVLHADSFIHDDLKIKNNVISGTVVKEKGSLNIEYSIPDGEKNNLSFKNYKDLYDYCGAVKWEDMCKTPSEKQTQKTEHTAPQHEDVCPDF